MESIGRTGKEWIDGFLFVANRPILDFLNTKPVLAQRPTELLPDFQALERWLISAGIVHSAKTKRLLRRWRETPEASAFHADLLAFRERLRDVVLGLERGSVAPDEFVREVNEGLQRHTPKTALRKQEGKIERVFVFDPEVPGDLWTPFLDGTAELLSEPDTPRLRRCEACVVHFFDTSKKGSRRWCSMNMCGNKLKVAAYQRRKREKGADV